jgi:hypothetical protein
VGGARPGERRGASWSSWSRPTKLERARATLAEARALDDERRRARAARITAAAREATDEPDDEAPAGEFTDGDVVRFVHLFAGRENVHARQWVGAGGETGYAPVREPFTVQVARNHLLGGITVGIYRLRLDDTVTLFARDVDIPGAREGAPGAASPRRGASRTSRAGRRGGCTPSWTPWVRISAIVITQIVSS